MCNSKEHFQHLLLCGLVLMWFGYAFVGSIGIPNLHGVT
jgi:hypothetical protein